MKPLSTILLAMDQVAIGRKSVVANFIATILIKTVTLSRSIHLFLLRSRDFDQATEAAKKIGIFNVQVEQHFIMWQFCRFMAQYYRCYVGQFVVSAAVRDKIR